MKADSKNQIPISLSSCKALFWFCIAVWGASVIGFSICFMALGWGLTCDWAPGLVNIFRNVFPWARLFDLYAFAGRWPLVVGAPVLLVFSIFARHAAGLFAVGADYLQAQRAGGHVDLG